MSEALGLYHSIRYPRSEKVQMTSRQAGDLYEMKSPDVAGRSYEDSLPIVKTKLEDRMKWIWSEDMDEVYEMARDAWRRSSSA